MMHILRLLFFDVLYVNSFTYLIRTVWHFLCTYLHTYYLARPDICPVFLGSAFLETGSILGIPVVRMLCDNFLCHHCL